MALAGYEGIYGPDPILTFLYDLLLNRNIISIFIFIILIFAH